MGLRPTPTAHHTDEKRAAELHVRISQETFDSAEELMEVVQERYPELMRPKQVMFGNYAITPDGIGQLLELVDQQGHAHHALYLVVRDGSGRWKINGCMLVTGTEAALAA